VASHDFVHAVTVGKVPRLAHKSRRVFVGEEKAWHNGSCVPASRHGRCSQPQEEYGRRL